MTVMNREPLRLELCIKNCAEIVRLHSCIKVYAQLNLLMAQMLVLNDTSVLYHLNHVTLGAGVASNLTETVH